MDTYAYTREYLARKHIEDLKGFDWFGSWKSKTNIGYMSKNSKLFFFLENK